MEASSRKYKNENGEWIEAQNRNNPFDYKGEINEEASMTVPSLSYSVQTIIEKHVRGINLPVNLKSSYEEGDIESPQVSKLAALDVTEVQEMFDQVQAKIATKKGAQNRQTKSADLSAKNPDVESGSAQIHT